MSVSLMSAVFAHGPKEPTARLVLLSLADFANNTGQSIWPSYATIAERAAISRRQAMRVVDRLIADGYLTASPRRHENGRAAANEYRIAVDRLRAPGDTHDTNMVSPMSPYGVTHDTNHSDTHDTNMVSPMTPDPPIDPSKSIRQRGQQPAAARAPGPLETTLRTHGVKASATIKKIRAAGWEDGHADYVANLASWVGWAHAYDFEGIRNPAAFLAHLLIERDTEAFLERVMRDYEGFVYVAGLEAVVR